MAGASPPISSLGRAAALAAGVAPAPSQPAAAGAGRSSRNANVRICGLRSISAGATAKPCTWPSTTPAPQTHGSPSMGGAGMTGPRRCPALAALSGAWRPPDAPPHRPRRQRPSATPSARPCPPGAGSPGARSPARHRRSCPRPPQSPAATRERPGAQPPRRSALKNTPSNATLERDQGTKACPPFDIARHRSTRRPGNRGREFRPSASFRGMPRSWTGCRRNGRRNENVKTARPAPGDRVFGVHDRSLTVSGR